MKTDKLVHRELLCVVIALGIVCGPSATAQDQKKVELVKESFQTTMARAKESGRPVAVFGMSDTCSRCQAVKDALASVPEFGVLLTQYEFSQIPFGGREFGEVFQEIVRRDNTIPPTIGAPSVFIFTSKGDTVYAGPNRENGITPDAELKKLLIAGFEKNGGVRRSSSTKSPATKDISSDLRKVRELLTKNDLSAAASLLSKHVKPSATAQDDTKELDDVLKLTGLKLAKSKDEEELEQLVRQVTGQVDSQVKAALASAGTEKAIVGAVKLSELNRTFGSLPFLTPTFETARRDLQAKSNDPKLMEQAELIGQAREAEKSGKELADVIAAYQLVVTTHPDTPAAKLCLLRIAQLEEKKPVPVRVWTSKSGKFTLSAALVSFDGTTARLKKSDGSTIEVVASALSAEDQRFLEASIKK